MRIVLSNAAMRWGGVHPLTATLARGLRDRGHEAVVFHRPGSAVSAMLGGVPGEPVLKETELSPTAIWRCARALRRHRPDVVVTMLEEDARLTAPVARILGIPVVVHRASDRPLRRKPHVRLLYGTLAAHHVAASEAARDAVLRSAPWLTPAAVTTIHGGIDPAPFDAAAPAELGLPPGAVAIGFVGRLAERKGILDLARAWPAVAREVPDAHLVVAGAGPMEGDARALLTAEPRVHWLGYRDDIPAVLKALDVVAVPSHREGSGRTVAEAMAAGRALVAARAGALPALAEDGAEALLVYPGDAGMLARALVSLARSPAVRERLGRAGRARVDADLSVGAMVDRWEAVLSATISAPRTDAWR